MGGGGVHDGKVWVARCLDCRKDLRRYFTEREARQKKCRPGHGVVTIFTGRS